MQRAAELALLYDHDRPIGEEYFTAFPYTEYTKYGIVHKDYGYISENVAANKNAKEAVIALREDDEPYLTQGHRRTMLDSKLLYVGIGHVIHDGKHWWALEYRETPISTEYTNPVNRKVNMPVEYKSSSDNENIDCGLPHFVFHSNNVGVNLNETRMLDVSLSLRSCGIVRYYGTFVTDIPVTLPYTITDVVSKDPEKIKVDLDTNNNSIRVTGLAEGTGYITIYATVQSGGNILLPSPVEMKYDMPIVVQKCDHNYTEKVLQYPTCTETGKKECTCTKCGKIKIETIPERQHNLYYYLYEGGQYHGIRCRSCDKVDIKEKHTFSPDYIKDYSNHAIVCTKCGYHIYEEHVYTKEPVIQFNEQINEWEMLRVCDKCGEEVKEYGQVDSYREEIIDCTSPRNRITTVRFHIDGKEYMKEIREEGYYPPLGHHFTRYKNNGNGTHIEVCGCCYTNKDGNYVECEATGAIGPHEYNQYGWCEKCYAYKSDESTGENQSGTQGGGQGGTTTPTPPSNIPVPGGDGNSGGGTADLPTNVTPSDPNADTSNNSTSTPSTSQIAVGKTELSQITNTSAGIELRWNKADNVTNYIVYRRIPNKGWAKIATVDSNVTKYTDKAVKSKNGTFYGYRIQTVNKGETGEYSEEKNIYRLTGAKLTSAKNSKSKKAAIKWKKASKINGYEVQYSTSKNFKKATTKKVKSASKKEYTISKLKKGKTYYIRLRTYKTVNKKNFYSAWSSAKKLKIKK